MNTRIIARSVMHAAAVAGVLMVCAPAAMNGAPQARGRQGSRNDPNQKDWIQLFNGRDLTGWTPKFAHHDLGENVNNTFRVEDGMLKVRYDKWPTFADQFGHLFYREPFSYYILAAEYRFVGEQVKTARHRSRLGDPQQRADDPLAGSEDDAQGSGFPDLDRGAAARRAGRRQAADDGEPVHAGDEYRHGREAPDGALHQLEVEDLRRRSVGARRGAGARRRADPAHGRRGDGAGVHEAADRRRLRLADRSRR